MLSRLSSRLSRASPSLRAASLRAPRRLPLPAARRPLGLAPPALHRMPDEGAASSPPPEFADKTSLFFSVSHEPGSLQRVLNYFWKHDVNMTRLESRPSSRGRDFNFFVSVEGRAEDPSVRALMADLGASRDCTHSALQDPREVPWFPTRVQDVDIFANEVLDAGSDLQSDHPGFNDAEYRARREELARLAKEHRFGDKFPRVQYKESETRTWGEVYSRLMPLHKQYACKQMLEVWSELERHCGYAPDNIPQIEDISSFLTPRSGFRLRPVAGLLSARNFLYGLAFRIFFSTQYIRHHSKPLYTPEPDICHELMGHVPLFADPDFADFSQEIGLAAIGATDEQITQLARCYWFTVEFGLCTQDGQRKAFGAGLLSSFGELEYAMSDKPEVLPWDPYDAAHRDYPITTYQPIYYLADSFAGAKDTMKEFSASFARPFNARYNESTETIEVDRDIRIRPLR